MTSNDPTGVVKALSRELMRWAMSPHPAALAAAIDQTEIRTLAPPTSSVGMEPLLTPTNVGTIYDFCLQQVSDDTRECVTASGLYFLADFNAARIGQYRGEIHCMLVEFKHYRTELLGTRRVRIDPNGNRWVPGEPSFEWLLQLGNAIGEIGYHKPRALRQWKGGGWHFNLAAQ